MSNINALRRSLWTYEDNFHTAGNNQVKSCMLRQYIFNIEVGFQIVYVLGWIYYIKNYIMV